MADLLSHIGIAAAVLTSLSYIPQVRKAWPRGATVDLSLHMLVVLTGGLALWILYGVMKADWVIVTANSVGCLLSATVLIFKLRDLFGSRRRARNRNVSAKLRSTFTAGYAASSEPHLEATMGFFTRDIKSMDDLLLHGLQDIYYAEQQITKALPTMIEQATNRDLAAGLRAHLEETHKQIERLEQVFKKLGHKPSGTDCPAIDGLIKESNATSGEIDDKSVLDAAIVANAQAVEHYEIARYGTLIAWAEELGHDDIVRFLTTNLNEEKAANTKLNTVALRKGVNRKAAS